MLRRGCVRRASLDIRVDDGAGFLRASQHARGMVKKILTFLIFSRTFGNQIHH